jgi:formylglycine-generating enzyme required for sulfatase activity
VYAGIPVNPGNGCPNLDSLVIHYERSGYRLPTEAEWEYACRGGTTTEYFWGDTADTATVKTFAWCKINSDSATQEVGILDTNNYGLHDMAGNVWEFINDYYDVYIGDETNPIGPEYGELLYRGGSFDDGFEKLRSYCRFSNTTIDFRDKTIGFRVARPRVNPF